MYFDTKNYLKNNPYHTAKHSYNLTAHCLLIAALFVLFFFNQIFWYADH
jgi:hypothetical protein